MANQTIYPYGTDGDLPSSIGIIDDIVTGGRDKALSAEQGKILGKSLANCFSGLEDKTHLSNGDLINATTNFETANYRIISKQSALIDVEDYGSFTMRVPYSAISDSNINRVILALFDSSKTYITGTQYDSWTLFNGQDAVITADKGSNVRYIGVYLGCASTSTSISPSDIDATKIEFLLTPSSGVEFKSKALSEDMVTSEIIDGSDMLITSGAVAQIILPQEPTTFTLTGNGNTLVHEEMVLQKGCEYELVIDPTNYPTVGTSNGINIYSLYYYLNNVSHEVFHTPKGSTVLKTHVFTAVEADYYTVGIRASVGTEVSFELTKISAEYVESIPNENSNKLITSGGVFNAIAPIKDSMTKELDMSSFTCSYAIKSNSTELKTRYRCAIQVPAIPISVDVQGVPEGLVIDLSSSLTIQNAISSTVNSIESSGWGVSSFKFTDTTAKVIYLNFKKGSAGTSNITDEEVESILEDVSVTFFPWLSSGGGGGGEDSTDIVSLNDERLTTRYLTNLKRPNISDNGQYTWGLSPFTLLHFSDIHADGVNLQRIMDYKEHYADFIDDAICTGDLIRNKFTDSYSFWDNAGAESVLVSTGNHEYYNGESSAYYTQITPKQVYDKFFAPYISEWGTVVFPENAATEGYNYYYKDYTSQKIRLIVLDNMANMSATRNNVQATWLASVLEDARLNNLHVICAIHIGSTIVTQYDSTFFSLANNINIDSGANSGTFAEFYTLRDAVEAFITNGGKFVCWIMGHRHKDAVELLTGYRQCCVHVATAAGGDTQRNVDGHVWWLIPQGDDCSRADDTKSQDCFNIYSIDTEKGLLRLFRVGNDLDRYGRHKGMLVYDYFNRQVIYSN